MTRRALRGVRLDYPPAFGLDRYHLHQRCFAAWEFERIKLGSIPLV